MSRDLGLSSVGSVDHPKSAAAHLRRRRPALKGLGRKLSLVAPAAAGLGLFALVWQLVALHNSEFLPRIGAIWQELSTSPGKYLSNGRVTLEEMAVGLLASFVAAFVLAVAMVHVRTVERAVMPLAVILNVTPVVSLAPGLSIALGVGLSPRFLVTTLICFFPWLVNALVGLRSVDPEAVDFLRSLNASRLEVLLRLRLPSCLPFLFAAARVCFPLAVVGAVVAEFSTSGPGQGLGSLISIGASTNYWSEVYASIFCLALLGLVLTLVVTTAERRLLVWHPARANR